MNQRKIGKDMGREHIEIIKKALEFRKTEYLPMEVIDVPGIYNAYFTLNPDSVKLVPDTENFDSIWVNCYSWIQEIIEKNQKGDVIRKDKFGIVQQVLNDKKSSYFTIKHPLAGKDSLDGYTFPATADDSDPIFKYLREKIAEKYSDRFIDGFIDPGFFETSQMLIGTQEMFYKIADNVNFVAEVFERVADYYKLLVPKFKNAGSHMITLIDSIGSNTGLVLNPKTWQKYFKNTYIKFFKYVHEQGLYASLCVDGNSQEILDDLFDMGIDLYFIPDINTTGIKVIKDKLKGKICLKATIDMKSTLALGTPKMIIKEAEDLVENLSSPNGGFICEVIRWYRPEYPPENVIASAEGFNKYRKAAY